MLLFPVSLTQVARHVGVGSGLLEIAYAGARGYIQDGGIVKHFTVLVLRREILVLVSSSQLRHIHDGILARLLSRRPSICLSANDSC
jgi:hypothetical protein